MLIGCVDAHWVCRCSSGVSAGFGYNPQLNGSEGFSICIHEQISNVATNNQNTLMSLKKKSAVVTACTGFRDYFHGLKRDN